MIRIATSISIALALALALGVVSTLDAQELTGCWAGTMGTGAGQIRGAFEFSNAAGAWQGSIHRLGADIDSDPFESVVLDGSAVEVTFPSSLAAATATFRGSVDGTSLSGTSEVGAQAVPMSFTRVDPATPDPALPLIGYWSGGLAQGPMVVLRLGVEFAPAPCGLVAVTMDSPDQGADNVPVSTVQVAGDSLSFAVASIAGSFSGEMRAGGDSIVGTWSQGPQSFDMRLARNAGPVSFARPQDPERPLPYTAFEVSYESAADGIELAGTLTLPNGNGPFPSALLLSGSGAQDRDEMLAGHRPFLVLSDYLTRRGVAVLRVDDRGVGGSTGNTMDATIEDNAIDALAGIEFLLGRPEIDPDRIGLIGHSEGGWLAPVVTAESDDVAFIVMLAGPAVTGREIVSEQTRLILEASGFDRIEARMELNGILLDVFTSPVTADLAGPELLAEVGRRIDSTPAGTRDDLRALWEGEVMATDIGRAQMEGQVAAMRSPWFRRIMDFDPEPFLDDVSVPVLALFGERDLQVPPAQTVPILEELWADHPDATVRVLPDLNHLFQHAETGVPAEYAMIDETLSPEVLEIIGDWLAARVVEP